MGLRTQKRQGAIEDDQAEEERCYPVGMLEEDGLQMELILEIPEEFLTTDTVLMAWERWMTTAEEVC